MNNTSTAHTQSKSSDCKVGQNSDKYSSSPPALIDDSNHKSSGSSNNNNNADVVDDELILRKYPDLPMLFRLNDLPPFRRPLMTKEKLHIMLQSGYFASTQPLAADMMQISLKSGIEFFGLLANRVHVEIMVLKACSTIDDDTDRSRNFRKELFDRMCEAVVEIKICSTVSLAKIDKINHFLNRWEKGCADHTTHDAATCLFQRRYAWMFSFIHRHEDGDAPNSLNVKPSESHYKFFSTLLRSSLEKLSAAEISPVNGQCLANKEAQLSYASNPTVLHKTVVDDLMGRRKLIAKEMEKLYIKAFLRNEDFGAIARFAIRRMLAEVEKTASGANDTGGATGERPLKKIKKEGTPV